MRVSLFVGWHISCQDEFGVYALFVAHISVAFFHYLKGSINTICSGHYSSRVADSPVHATFEPLKY